VNWQHLQTILWLRWRMSLNQLRRGGIASKIILAFLAVCVLGTSVSMFFVSLFVGTFALPKASPAVIMIVWDAVVVAFIFFWLIGLVTELQRSEVLSLQKLLHLPVSLAGTFLINYVGSLLSLSLVVFLPGMIGLSIALMIAKGPAMVMVFPLLAGFLLMVTAITYQFQGWLAALMLNQRRRRTIIAVATISIVLMAQLPNLINVFFWGRSSKQDPLTLELQVKTRQLNESHQKGKLDDQDYKRQLDELNSAHQARVKEVEKQTLKRVEQIFTRVNLVLPIGWLPYGAMSSANGNVLPALWGTIGAGLIGAGSLWRSYRTTLRIYIGHFTARQSRTVPSVKPTAVKPAPGSVRLIELRLPIVSEQVSAVAMASFRSLIRGPEAKMLIMTPAILVVVFGSMLLGGRIRPPELARPYMAFGAGAMIMLTLMQIVGNQFGLDRQGFRFLVLSSASRRDILLGKNIALVPLALGLGLFCVAFVEVGYPLETTHFLATLAELISLFLVSCLVGNLTSILAPIPMAAGSLKPANIKAIPMLIQLGFFLLFPIVYGLSLVPLGLEQLLHFFGWFNGVPIYLIGAALELVVVTTSYYFILIGQGRLLHAREQTILSTVTAKVE